MQFHPEEWRQYSNFQPVFGSEVPSGCRQALIAHDDAFTLALTCWDPKHVGPPHHQCGSKCWIKVLEGTLCENHYNVVQGNQPAVPSANSFGDITGEGQDSAQAESKLELSRNATLSKGSVTFVSGLAVHSLDNVGMSKAFSVHLYVPPRKGLFLYR